MDTYALRENLQIRLLDREGLVGHRIAGRFRVEALLARGATGRVYIAEQVGLSRKVAVKVLDLEAELASGLDFSLRFSREAETLARLSHPNTVRVVDYGIWEGRTWLAMEYVEGLTLLQALRTQEFTPQRTVALMLQVCSALTEAHELGVVHRDLKPSNLLLSKPGTPQEQVKIVDFGLVKDLHERGHKTSPGALMGSPRYMAPEQIKVAEVDARVDIYALGAVLHRCLTGVAPFEGPDPLPIMYAHLHREAPAVTTEGVPDCLRWVVARCLQKEPDRRFAHVPALTRALERCQEVLREERPWDTELRASHGRVEVVDVPAPPRSFPIRRVGQVTALAAAIVVGFLLGRTPSEPTQSVNVEVPVEGSDADSPAWTPAGSESHPHTAPMEVSVPAVASVEAPPPRARRARSAGSLMPLVAIVNSDPGIIPNAHREPAVELEADSPWADPDEVVEVASTPEDPWAMGEAQ